MLPVKSNVSLLPRVKVKPTEALASQGGDLGGALVTTALCANKPVPATQLMSRQHVRLLRIVRLIRLGFFIVLRKFFATTRVGQQVHRSSGRKMFKHCPESTKKTVFCDGTRFWKAFDLAHLRL